MTEDMPADAPPETRAGASVWTWIGLAIALVGPPALTAPPMQRVFELAGSDNGAVFVGQSFLWLILALALACLVFGERLPLSAASIAPPRLRSIVTGLLIGAAVYAVLFGIVVLLVQFDLFDAKAGANVVSGWPLWLRVFALATAGIVEEALYRGYAIERLTALVGRRWLAALIALAFFAVAHVPFWGLAALATPILGGGFFTLVYLWRRDLVACMVAHMAVDFVGLILAPAFGAGG